MKEYTKPYVANYGKAFKVTEGDCGLGIEMPGFDKTGGKMYYGIYEYQCWDSGVVRVCQCQVRDSGICAKEPYLDTRCYN